MSSDECMYDAQGYLKCDAIVEGFISYPKCGSLFGKAACPAGMYCMDGTCTPTKYTHYDANTCNYFSGAGISQCKATLSDSVCGPKNNNTKCSPGRFCTLTGTCDPSIRGMDGSDNCIVYSGQHAEGCTREVSVDGKCGPNNSYRRCPPQQFCASGGKCQKNPDKTSPYCNDYSGEGTNNCDLLVTPSSCGPKNKNAKCPANQFCNDKGACELARSSSSSYATNCNKYSGSGIDGAACTYTATDPLRCGPTSRTRCGPGMFCTAGGTCQTTGDMSDNCMFYSGIGTSKCKLVIAPVNNAGGACGPKANAVCSPFQFCGDNEKCTSTKPNGVSFNNLCNGYSGAGITGCQFVNPSFANYAMFSSTKGSFPRSATSTTLKNQSLASCVEACTNSKDCRSLLFTGPIDANTGVCLMTNAKNSTVSRTYNAPNALYAYNTTRQ